MKYAGAFIRLYSLWFWQSRCSSHSLATPSAPLGARRV